MIDPMAAPELDEEEKLLACGPAAAEFYWENGLRVVPIRPDGKAQSRRGNCRANPDFTVAPSNFRPDELVGIIMGECPLGSYAGGRLLCGLDFDGNFSPTDLEAHLEHPLPYTLSSKNSRHLYYWITPEQQQKGELRQGNDVLKTKSSLGGALDLRPAAGGYFLERGSWDLGFDRTRIRDLPDAVHSALLAARSTARVGRPLLPCTVELDAYAKGDSPMAQIDELLIDVMARLLASRWPKPGEGGGHDLGLALGGILADAHGSVDDVLEFANRVFFYAQCPSALPEVLTSFTKRRQGVNAGIFGWPTLNRMLCAVPGADPEKVRLTLKKLREVIPGLARGASLRAKHAAQDSAIAKEWAMFRGKNRPDAPTFDIFRAQWLLAAAKKESPEA